MRNHIVIFKTEDDDQWRVQKKDVPIDEAIKLRDELLSCGNIIAAEIYNGKMETTEATVAEMTDHCATYACFECPLRPRCGMLRKMQALTSYDNIGFCGDTEVSEKCKGCTPQCEKNIK
jgi:hypothetical protein